MKKEDPVVYAVMKETYTTYDMDVITSSKVAYVARDEAKAKAWAERAQDNARSFSDTPTAFFIQKRTESAIPEDKIIH